MKHDNLSRQAEEMARNIANLKGKELEDYIADAEEVLKLVKKRLKEGNHSDKMTRAYQETKITLEQILEIVVVNRSN
jgi:hypothetical protein